MSDAPIPVLLLSVIAFCLVAMTLALCSAAWELHLTLRRLNGMLPDAAGALREARRSSRHLRRLLASAARATQRVEGAVERICDAASETLERALGPGRRVRNLFTPPHGKPRLLRRGRNGAVSRRVLP